MSEILFPRPLQPGDTIGVTSPSSGVPERLRPRARGIVQKEQE